MLSVVCVWCIQHPTLSRCVNTALCDRKHSLETLMCFDGWAVIQKNLINVHPHSCDGG